VTAEPGRFVLAPVVDGSVDWARATDLVLAPIRLSSPVVVALAWRQRWATGLR
jgi:hypothetical protein